MDFSKYKLIVWDFNGTILDDAKLCYELTNQSLREAGKEEVDFARWRKAYQHPIRNMYAALGLELPEEEYKEVATRWLRRYEEARVGCKIHHGVTNFFNFHREASRRQVLLSAHQHEYVLDSVRHLGIEEVFECILGNERAGDRKEENARRLLDDVQVRGEETLFVGDTSHDHEVAEEVGADCVLLSVGHDCPERIAATGRPIFESYLQWYEISTGERVSA